MCNYSICSKCHSSTWKQAINLCTVFFATFRRLRQYLQRLVQCHIEVLQASWVFAVDFLRNPHRKKSAGMRSGNRGSQSPHPAIPSQMRSCTKAVVLAVWAVAQSCWNQQCRLFSSNTTMICVNQKMLILSTVSVSSENKCPTTRFQHTVLQTIFDECSRFSCSARGFSELHILLLWLLSHITRNYALLGRGGGTCGNLWNT